MFVSLLIILLNMKKILLSLLLTTFVIAAQAQFGVNAGLNISSLNGSALGNANSKTGFHIGAFYQQHPASKNISVQAEVAYSAEGAKFSSGNTKDLFDYLNLAALFRYNFEGGFNLATGPQYGFLLSAKSKNSSGTQDLKGIIKNNNFSWAFSAGYDLPMNVGFYARYNLGLSNIIKDVQGGDVKMSTFQLGVRYNFNAGREEHK